MLKKICFTVSAVLCFVAAFFHEIEGGKLILAPLEASDISVRVKGMLTFSWHTDVVLMLATTILFLLAAYTPNNKLMGVIATAIVVGIGINAFGMAIFYDPIMWDTPAVILWSVIPAISVVGLLAKSAN